MHRGIGEHAKDYVVGMWLILQAEEPEDFVLASGKTTKVREFVELAFQVVGIDIEWKDKNGSKTWMEVLGCGMVNPEVFESVNYNSDDYTGLAFGMGIERLAMIKFGITDIRYFYQNDLKFLKQF